MEDALSLRVFAPSQDAERSYLRRLPAVTAVELYQLFGAMGIAPLRRTGETDLQLLPKLGQVDQVRVAGRVTPSVSSLGIDSSGNPSKGTEFVCGVGGFQQ